jgi:hypothetical protein
MARAANLCEFSRRARVLTLARPLPALQPALDPEHPPDPVAVKEVLRYFVRHPQAVDDLEGIARWRLAEEVIRHKVEETHRALTWLVERDFLHLTRTVGPTPVFSLNPDKVTDANALLASNEPIDPADRNKG